MNRKTVEIQCTGADSLPLDKIVEFQGTLKRRTKKDLEKIKKSILKYGFSFPFFVWRNEGVNHCMDGHGRLQALKELGESMELPEFPVSWVEAKNADEAKQKLLRLNSQYGEMTIESVLEFTEGLEMEWDDLELPGGILEVDGTGLNEEEKETYSRKILAPNYLPKNEKPAIKDLMDTGKAESFIKEIEASSLPEDDKKFLIAAAMRHVVFNYQKIADYYANSNEEVQDLMEKSALIIIDFDKAIENGYVRLADELLEQYREENNVE